LIKKNVSKQADRGLLMPT